MKLTFKKIDFALKNYYAIDYNKTQLVLHHTASGGNCQNMADYFNSDKQRVAVCSGIDRDGTICQLFNFRHYAFHLGVDDKDFRKWGLINKNVLLTQTTIANELICWGWLRKDNNKFYSWTNKEISSSEVISYEKEFNGKKHFHIYTKEQIESLKNFIEFIGESFKIPIKYSYDTFFVQNKNALNGVPGLYSHVSYKGWGKTDLHPQPELIQMLENFK